MTQGQASKKAPPSSSLEPRSEPTAWQPFTPQGIASFARTTLGRVLTLLCVVALLTSGSAVWFLKTAWFPTIRAAIQELPNEGQISHQELKTPRTTTDPLAEHRFLGFVVLVSQGEGTDLSSHIAVKFRKQTFELCSIFGCARFRYPADWNIEFSRLALEARWGAWEPVITAIAAIGSFLGLLSLWIVVGFVYSFIPWLIALIKKRDLTWAGSWRMCCAALMPGALLFVLGIWIYGLGMLHVLQFVIVAVAQIVAGWVWIGFGVRVLPARPPRARRKANPFT
jgi:hypothetical protein